MRYLLQLDPDVMREEKSIVRALDRLHSFVRYEELTTIEDKTSVVPVGSVEFVERYASLNGISLPEDISYPQELLDFLGRRVWSSTYADVRVGQFCKPKRTKVFTGCIKSNEDLIGPDTKVWVSDPVSFTSEWRFYVLGQQVLGSSRYDDGDNEETPDVGVVKSMVQQFARAPIGYCLDVGLVDGKTVLVEANDGWALGYYRWGDMQPRDYVRLITERWMEIVNA